MYLRHPAPLWAERTQRTRRSRSPSRSGARALSAGLSLSTRLSEPTPTRAGLPAPRAIQKKRLRPDRDRVGAGVFFRSGSSIKDLSFGRSEKTDVLADDVGVTKTTQRPVFRPKGKDPRIDALHRADQILGFVPAPIDEQSHPFADRLFDQSGGDVDVPFCLSHTEEYCPKGKK